MRFSTQTDNGCKLPLFDHQSPAFQAQKRFAELVEKHIEETLSEYKLTLDDPITLVYRGNLFWIAMFGERIGKILHFNNTDKNGK